MERRIATFAVVLNVLVVIADVLILKNRTMDSGTRLALIFAVVFAGLGAAMCLTMAVRPAPGLRFVLAVSFTALALAMSIKNAGGLYCQ